MIYTAAKILFYFDYDTIWKRFFVVVFLFGRFFWTFSCFVADFEIVILGELMVRVFAPFCSFNLRIYRCMWVS